MISAYFEDSQDVGEPQLLSENANYEFIKGSIVLGDGFLLPHEEAQSLIADVIHAISEVVFPVTQWG